MRYLSLAVAVAFAACLSTAVLMAQTAAPGATPPATYGDLMALLSSVGGVIVCAMALTSASKRLFGQHPWFGKPPIWIYVEVYAVLVALLANKVLGVLPGPTSVVVTNALLAGASASGVYSWFSNGLTTSMSTTVAAAQVATKLIVIAVLAGALGLGVSACSSNPQVNLVHGSQSLTAALQTAQTAENLVCGVSTTDPMSCTQVYPGVTATALTTAHRSFEHALGKIADDKVAFDKQAKTWTPGSGVPTSLTNLQADVNLLLSAYAAFPTTAVPTATLVTQLQGAINLVAGLLADAAK